jgi:hypothetical protein
VANDTRDHFLYRNDGRPGRIHFVEIGGQAGVARDERGVPTGSRGIDVGDFNGSGRLSLLATDDQNETHALYHNEGGARTWFFRLQSPAAGLAMLNRARIGWGAAFLDLNNDGKLDLVMVGSPGQGREHGQPLILLNEGKYTLLQTRSGGFYFQLPYQARGVALVDLDNDGLVDLVISRINEPLVILQHQAATRNHWIGFELVGKNHRDVVGAKVVVETDTRTQTSFAQSGGSYLSSSDRRHLFGLGPTEKVKRIRVIWPGAKSQQWDGLAVDRYWRLTEGEGAEELPCGR